MLYNFSKMNEKSYNGEALEKEAFNYDRTPSKKKSLNIEQKQTRQSSHKKTISPKSADPSTPMS